MAGDDGDDDDDNDVEGADSDEEATGWDVVSMHKRVFVVAVVTDVVGRIGDD